MRTTALVSVFAICLLYEEVGARNVLAGPPDGPAVGVAAAERAVELAQLRLRRYARVEYPLKLRKLESEIKLTEAELGVHQDRVAEYERFEKNAYSSPLFFSLQQARLALVESELRLADLGEEKLLLVRYHTDQCRLYELELEEARERLEAVRAAR